ncbi:MAG TPA: hypothetical protein VGM90_10415 [Kofleriaceae bacterium]
MIQRECYECGLSVELPDGTFRWECAQCGYTDRTREEERKLRARYAHAPKLAKAVDELIQELNFELGDEASAKVAIDEISRQMQQLERPGGR